MNRLSTWASANFFILVIVFAALGLLQAQWQQDLQPYIEQMLGLVIFAMALTLSFEDFAKVFKQPHRLALGVAAQYLIMPLAAFLIARLVGLPQELAVGLVLVGSCPGGTVSNVLVYIAKADLPLSVSMTFSSTFIAPLTLPFMMWLYASHWIEIDALALFWAAIKIVLIPLIVGLSMKLLIKKQSENLDSIVSLSSVLLVCVIIMIMVAVGAPRIMALDNIQEHLLRVLLGVFLLTATGMIAGYYLPKLIDKNLNQSQLRAIAIEVSMQNSGLASVLALIHFGPLAVVPAIFAATWNCIAGSLLANYWSTRT